MGRKYHGPRGAVDVLTDLQLYDVNTKEPAIFSHAAIFAESDDQESGNFVPQGQLAPAGVDIKSV